MLLELLIEIPELRNLWRHSKRAESEFFCVARQKKNACFWFSKPDCRTYSSLKGAIAPGDSSASRISYETAVVHCSCALQLCTIVLRWRPEEFDGLLGLLGKFSINNLLKTTFLLPFSLKNSSLSKFQREITIGDSPIIISLGNNTKLLKTRVFHERGGIFIEFFIEFFWFLAAFYQ